MTKRTIKLTLAFVLTLSLLASQTACSASQLATNADRVASALDRAQPAFQTLIDGGVIQSSVGANIIARVLEGANDARTLATAFRANNASGAVDQTAALIRIVDQLIDTDAKLIPAGPKRTFVLAILGTADLALGIISDELVKQGHAHHVLFALSGIPQSSTAVIRQFAHKPRLRCRNSQTGRFEKMEFCKAHPDVSVVDRVKPKAKS